MTLASFCTNCGAQRADRDVFCRTCGTSLAVRGAPGEQAKPEAAIPPPVTTGAVVSSPPLAQPPSASTPSATPATDHTTVRLPLRGLVAIVLGASALATAVALGVAVVLAPAPGSNDDGIVTGGLRTVEVEYIRAELPAEWDLVRRARYTIVSADRTSRTLWLRSAPVPAPMSIDDVQQRFLDRAQADSPDARICAGPETAAVPGGPTDGRYFVICSTFIPQGGGPAARLADAYYLGVGGDGLTVVTMQLTATPETLEGFAAQVRDLPPPVWKLLQAAP